MTKQVKISLKNYQNTTAKLKTTWHIYKVSSKQLKKVTRFETIKFAFYKTISLHQRFKTFCISPSQCLFNTPRNQLNNLSVCHHYNFQKAHFVGTNTVLVKQCFGGGAFWQGLSVGYGSHRNNNKLKIGKKGGVDCLPFWLQVSSSKATSCNQQFSESEWWGFLPSSSAKKIWYVAFWQIYWYLKLCSPSQYCIVCTTVFCCIIFCNTNCIALLLKYYL